ncbi:MAG: PEGA domain-containing protein [Prevotella sp.]|nr:PEGA domain-containing protein [Prevotella sp.]
MKKLLLLALIAVSQSVWADGISVLGFRLLETDLTANTRGTEKRDQNGDKAALIKIVTPERGFLFNGGSLGIVGTEEKAAEIWLYVSPRAQKLTITHQVFGVLRDYYYPVSIQGGRTYEMLLDIGTGRYVTITTSQAKSDVTVDGEYLGQSPIYNKYLTYGRHAVMTQNGIYEGKDTIIVATTDEKGTKVANIQMRNMSDHYGEVVVNVENNADIWFNDHQVGTGSWQTQLREGAYTVETRKADCDPVKTNFTVVPQKRNQIQAAPPAQHTGRLNIYTRPRNAMALLNGTDEINLTDVPTLPVGTYQIALSRKGYVGTTREYTVKHNITTTDTVSLEKVRYIKPNSFYFGAGYTMRSLGGITALAGATYKNIDLQLSYTFGLGSSDPVRWYSTDGNDTYLSSATYKRSTFAAKLGYQIELTERLGIVPQLGFQTERLSGKVTDGTNLYGDGASASCVSVGAKLLFAPIERFYVFAAPELSIGVSKDDNFKRISDASNISAGGFMISIGAIFNFSF